jgi:hypothetical protein
MQQSCSHTKELPCQQLHLLLLWLLQHINSKPQQTPQRLGVVHPGQSLLHGCSCKVLDVWAVPDRFCTQLHHILYISTSF